MMYRIVGTSYLPWFYFLVTLPSYNNGANLQCLKIGAEATQRCLLIQHYTQKITLFLLQLDMINATLTLLLSRAAVSPYFHPLVHLSWNEKKMFATFVPAEDVWKAAARQLKCDLDSFLPSPVILWSLFWGNNCYILVSFRWWSSSDTFDAFDSCLKRALSLE